MCWHNKDIQIAVFCDVTPHAVADMYWHLGESTISTFRISDPNNSMQDNFLLVGGGEGRGLGAIKILSNFLEPSIPCLQEAD